MKMAFITFLAVLAMLSGKTDGGTSIEDLRLLHNLMLESRSADKYWILHEDLTCATAFDVGLINSEHRHTDRVNNLIEPDGLRKKREAEHTGTLKYVHSILLFKGRLYDRMPDGERIFDMLPRHIFRCQTTVLDETHQGTSTCSKEHVDLFTAAYTDLYGTYGLFNNNCHYFTNRVASFITGYKCGRYGIPSGFCYYDDTPECLDKVYKLRERLCHISSYWRFRNASREDRLDDVKANQRSKERFDCIRAINYPLVTDPVVEDPVVEPTAVSGVVPVGVSNDHTPRAAALVGTEMIQPTTSTTQSTTPTTPTTQSTTPTTPTTQSTTPTTPTTQSTTPTTPTTPTTQSTTPTTSTTQPTTLQPTTSTTQPTTLQPTTSSDDYAYYHPPQSLTANGATTIPGKIIMLLLIIIGMMC